MLYVIPTPVGNLEDITLRAVRLLREADFILAEDTRTSAKLMKHLDIQVPMYSHHKFNEHKTVGSLVERIKDCQHHVALISDAGTPGISDPGFLLVRESVRNGVEVQCLPGATAFVPAILGADGNDSITIQSLTAAPTIVKAMFAANGGFLESSTNLATIEASEYIIGNATAGVQAMDAPTYNSGNGTWSVDVSVIAQDVTLIGLSGECADGSTFEIGYGF